MRQELGIWFVCVSRSFPVWPFKAINGTLAYITEVLIAAISSPICSTVSYKCCIKAVVFSCSGSAGMNLRDPEFENRRSLNALFFTTL